MLTDILLLYLLDDDVLVVSEKLFDAVIVLEAATVLLTKIENNYYQINIISISILLNSFYSHSEQKKILYTFVRPCSNFKLQEVFKNLKTVY